MSSPPLFASSGLSGRQLYARTESTWNFLSVLGALLSAMAFLAFQKVRGEEKSVGGGFFVLSHPAPRPQNPSLPRA